MQIFKVLQSMETAEILEGTLRDHLTPNAVLLIVDYDSKKIYFYKGRRARLSLQVLGALVAQDLRRQLKLFYSVAEVLGWEPLPEFFSKLLDITPRKDKAEAIKKPVQTSPAEKETKKKEEKPAPPPPEPAWGGWKPPGGPIAPVHWNIMPKDVLKKMQATPPPEGYLRNILQVGGELFSEDSFLEKFVQERKQVIELEKIGGLPDGFTLIDGLPFRLFGARGQVEAIEYLVPANRVPQVEVRIEAPVLYKDRFLHQRDPALLIKAFKLPPENEVIIEAPAPGAQMSATPAPPSQPPAPAKPAPAPKEEEKLDKKKPFTLK